MKEKVKKDYLRRTKNFSKPNFATETLLKSSLRPVYFRKQVYFLFKFLFQRNFLLAYHPYNLRHMSKRIFKSISNKSRKVEEAVTWSPIAKEIDKHVFSVYHFNKPDLPFAVFLSSTIERLYRVSAPRKEGICALSIQIPDVCSIRFFED